MTTNTSPPPPQPGAQPHPPPPATQEPTEPSPSNPPPPKPADIPQPQAQAPLAASTQSNPTTTTASPPTPITATTSTSPPTTASNPNPRSGYSYSYSPSSSLTQRHPNSHIQTQSAVPNSTSTPYASLYQPPTSTANNTSLSGNPSQLPLHYTSSNTEIGTGESGFLDNAKAWFWSAGNKLAEVEAEVWRRINEAHDK
ncbi:hypothetical protein ANOM_011693 [Aspergillus nomiae NRRL 13137]|uniref:Uncharacterized protein n=1 Tax=Aspergillus nomiae NRRL (strain ATCC 15546 / NRRL 13137 / CBS 260.88 / M93) TaxID=1509407 RepID=A0A0L1IKM8_ASPN3|nr:uncharacterized protein ANOM_011693 [Aspergillus nomiae NRRL 13137]KNG80119.1 hypothetical protein ANOM_011693 [Aspergillus nomiae NRRL 13137]